jgi:hypothetical protein
MPDEAHAQLIIDQANVKEIPNTFSLGCYAKRVTFYSQQNRALNLIWALFKKSKINEKSNVAIVGGGLAGMTAAIAAKLKGCSVSLFEAEDEFMPIQRGNSTRYIHPNIYEWPAIGSEKDETELPFLNWSAGVTEEVVKQIENGWLQYSEGIEVNMSTYVKSIYSSGNDTYILTGFKPLKFDCVILAVGFGAEKPMENVAMTLYWTTDGLHQSNGWNKKTKYLVSGCGDGGLIDTLRLTIKDFKHKDFTKKFLTEDFEKTYHDLLKIDQSIKENDPEKASLALMEAYEKISIPKDLDDYIKANLRRNNEVVLNGRTPTFLTLESSIINRFAVYLVMRAEKVTFTHGDISVTKKDSKYTVTFKRKSNSETDDFDEIVVRHGPEPVIGKLTDQYFAHYDSDKRDQTAKKLWPEDFYQIPGLITTTTSTTTTKAPKCKRDLAYEYYDEFKELLIGLRFFKGCFVGGTETNPEYLVSLGSQKIPKDFEKYPSYKGIPVTYTVDQKFKFSMASADTIPAIKNSINNDVLMPGIAIRNKDLVRGRTGTIGCFVMTRDGLPALLSTSHVLSPNGENLGRIVAKDFNGATEKIVADLLTGVRLFSRRASKHQLPSVALLDAAIATLLPGTKFTTEVPLEGGKKINVEEVGEAEMDEVVYKYSLTNGLTKGKIIAVHGTVYVEYEKTDRLFKEVILVESEEDKPFASAGDSGSLVYNKRGLAIGIVFGIGKKTSIICPLPSILKYLDCKLFSPKEL